MKLSKYPLVLFPFLLNTQTLHNGNDFSGKQGQNEKKSKNSHTVYSVTPSQSKGKKLTLPLLNDSDCGISAQEECLKVIFL